MTDRGPFIFTNSGRKYHFLDPHPADIVLSDIAHSLSNLCRYDATAACCGDVSKPLKTLLPAYAIIEGKAEAAIAKRFAVDCSTAHIKECDLIMLATELPIVINYHAATVGAFEWLPLPCTIPIQCLAPEDAKALFLRTAESVGLCAV